MSGYYNRNNRGITKKLGPVTAYADAVLAGYTGTREQWAQDMAKLGKNVTQVAQNTKLTTELAEQTSVNTEQVAKDTADVRRLAEETSDNAAQVASNTAESNRLAEETKQAAAQAKADAEYAGSAADNFRVDTTLSEEGKAAEAKTTGEKFAQLSEEIGDLGYKKIKVQKGKDGFFAPNIGDFYESEDYTTSIPFAVKAGEVVKVTAAGYDQTVCIIGKCDDEEFSNPKSLVASPDDVVRDYTYTADEDMFIFVGFRTDSHEKTVVYPNIERVLDETQKVSPLSENLTMLQSVNISADVNDVEISKIDGGFVDATKQGEISTLSIYFYTELYALTKGNKVIVTSADPSGSAVARISKWTADASKCEKIIAVGTTEETTVEYTATEDVEYLRFSGINRNPFDVKLAVAVVPVMFEEVVKRIVNETTESDSPLSMSVFSDIAVCGDSYTEGAICTRDSNLGTLSVIGYAPYGNMLARMTGCNVTTYASSGANTNSYQTRNGCLPKILSESPKELYIFSLGINDSDKKPFELGTLSDIKEDHTQNANTFYGNYGKIIAQVKEHAPNAKIVLSTVFIPTYSSGEYYDYSATAIKEIAEHFGVMFVDTKDVAFLSSDKYNSDIKANGGHPTAPTYSAIAKGVQHLIDKCIENNISYFNTFIPSNT